MVLSELAYYDAFSRIIPTFPTFQNDENFSRDDLEILHAISSARTTRQCNEMFALAMQRFGTDAFASGEVDVKNRDRTIFYSMAEQHGLTITTPLV